jgi:hypothetical protein
MENPVNAVPSQPYEYTSLEDPASQIRLLEVTSKDDSCNWIECTLTT